MRCQPLPRNIVAGAPLYPECLDAPAGEIAGAALRELARDPAEVREALRGAADALSWEDAGEVVAAEVKRLVGGG